MIRVLRIIEYTYEDAEAMTKDMARWTHQSPPGNTSMSFKSVAMVPTGTKDFTPCAEPEEFYGAFGYKLVQDGNRVPKTGEEFEAMLTKHGGLDA